MPVPTRVSSERFDVVVIGAGPGGEVVAWRLAPRGLRVALVERELIGGECAYWACVPSKTLLRPAEIEAEAAAGFGTARETPDWPAVVAYRDYMVRNYDDAKQVAEYGEMGVTVVKGAGHLVEAGVVLVGKRRLEAPHIVVATGSEPTLPRIQGLRKAGFWTNREATGLRTVPRTALVIGGGPVAVELGQMLNGFGSRVTIAQRSRLLRREDERVGELLADALVRSGIDVRLGVEVKAVHAWGLNRIAELSDGSAVKAEVVVVATGRKPRLRGLGLGSMSLGGAETLSVDDFGRVRAGLWGVGDVTGVALFTHVAKYQGRVVAANLRNELRGGGAPRTLDYSAVPRVVFSEPEVAAVGRTEEQLRAAGIPVNSIEVAMADITRPYTFSRDPTGTLRLLTHAETGVVLGATIVAPLASEYIHVAALAVRAVLTASFLRDSVFQYPTFSEAYTVAAEKLTA